MIVQLDNLIGWIIMAAAVLPVVFVLLRHGAEQRRAIRSVIFSDNPRRTAARLQGTQAGHLQNKKSRPGKVLGSA